MAKRDGGHLNQVNMLTDESLDSHKDVVGLGSTGEPQSPPFDQHGFTVKGKQWEGQDGQTVGQPVELTDRGAAPEGGHDAAKAAQAAIGAKVSKSHYLSGMLHTAKGDEGEKIEIPSESNLNSANKRLGS